MSGKRVPSIGAYITHRVFPYRLDMIMTPFPSYSFVMNHLRGALDTHDCDELGPMGQQLTYVEDTCSLPTTYSMALLISAVRTYTLKFARRLTPDVRQLAKNYLGELKLFLKFYFI